MHGAAVSEYDYMVYCVGNLTHNDTSNQGFEYAGKMGAVFREDEESEWETQIYFYVS